LAIAKMNLVGNTRLGKKLQRAANCGITNAGVLGPQFQVKFLNAEMLLRRKKEFQN